MVTRTQRRQIVRRIVAAGLMLGTGAGIVTADTVASAEPVCLDIGQVTYIPAPGAKPLTVPECAHKVAPGCAEIVGSDGVAHPIGQPTVDIQPCRGHAGEGTPRRDVVPDVPTAGAKRPGGRKQSFRDEQRARDAAAVQRRGGRYWSTAPAAVPAGASQRERDMAERSAARRARVTGGRN